MEIPAKFSLHKTDLDPGLGEVVACQEWDYSKLHGEFKFYFYGTVTLSEPN